MEVHTGLHQTILRSSEIGHQVLTYNDQMNHSLPILLHEKEDTVYHDIVYLNYIACHTLLLWLQTKFE
jgi:hypothetical protein